MGNTNSRFHKKISFEDVQSALQSNHQYLFINTLPIETQDCLLPNTIRSSLEEELLNRYIQEGKTASCQIILYGKNSNDETVDKKFQQLINLGFKNVYIYSGGLFEWFLLQDIYVNELFPTTNKENDLLRFKPAKTFGIYYLE